jgi:hypothetical protein
MRLGSLDGKRFWEKIQNSCQKPYFPFGVWHFQQAR